MFLFLRRSEDLETDEQETLLTLRHLHSEIDLAYDLVQQFAQMLRTRTGDQLDAWQKLRQSERDPRVAGLRCWRGTRQGGGEPLA